MKQERSFSVFLAGTMQGSRQGAEQVPQGYRVELSAIITATYPNAEIFCPLVKLGEKLAGREASIRECHAALSGEAVVRKDNYALPLVALTDAFVELSLAAAKVDLLVAFLPDREASMGTAIEMWSAATHGVPVVTISELRQNLAILSTSSVILKNIEQFQTFVSSGQLETFLDGRVTQVSTSPGNSSRTWSEGQFTGGVV